jgi:uncharacterized alkaline shock family protein YloU
MLIVSILYCLIFSGLVEFDLISNYIKGSIAGETSGKVLLGGAIVFILLSIRSIFFEADNGKQENKKKSDKGGILLENENGKLIISRETIENLVNTLAKEYDTVKEVTTKVDVDSESKLIINIEMIVDQSAMISELSASLQEKVKNAIKNTSNLDVRTTNIRIKDYTTNANC